MLLAWFGHAEIRKKVQISECSCISGRSDTHACRRETATQKYLCMLSTGSQSRSDHHAFIRASQKPPSLCYFLACSFLVCPFFAFSCIACREGTEFMTLGPSRQSCIGRKTASMHRSLGPPVLSSSFVHWGWERWCGYSCC